MTRQELFENIKKKQSFLCVGLDTDIKKIQDITDHYNKIVENMQSIIDLNNVWYERDDVVGNYKKASYYTDNIAAQ